MSEANQAQLFISLLSDAYEADHMLNRAEVTTMHKARSKRFQAQHLTSLNKFWDTQEPLDCVQLIGGNLSDSRLV